MVNTHILITILNIDFSVLGFHFCPTFQLYYNQKIHLVSRPLQSVLHLDPTNPHVRDQTSVIHICSPHPLTHIKS